MPKLKSPPFKVGDEVTSEYWKDEVNIVRKITKIFADEKCGSGFAASASNGGICKRCGYAPGSQIPPIDAGWFQKVKTKAKIKPKFTCHEQKMYEDA